MKKRSSEPEYLFVGERKNLLDQQARLQDELIGRLRDFDVYLQRVYFQSDPSICSDSKGQIYSLGELAVQYPNHELWLALESNACLEPATREPKPWFATLDQWRERALLSFTVPPNPLEIKIAEPTRRGLEDLAGLAVPVDEWNPFPSLLRDSPERWVQRVPPPEADTPRLDIQLQLYLGESGFLLLQACAVYPALAWNITRALATKVLDSESKEKILARLSSLPWFRHATMPDWLRVRLIHQLRSDEPRVRQILRDYLSQTVADVFGKQDTLDIVPGKPRKAEEQSALDDHIYLSFATGQRLDRLSIEAPRKWRKFLRDSISLRIVMAVLSMTLTWFFLTNLLAEIKQEFFSQPGTPIAIDYPRNPYVSELYTVATALDAPMPSPKNAQAPDLIDYSRLASNVLNVVDPFTSVSALQKGSQQQPRQNLAPGMVVNFGGHLQMIRYVVAGRIRLFQSPRWRTPNDFEAIYDLSTMATSMAANAPPKPINGNSGPSRILAPPSAPNGNNEFPAPGTNGPHAVIIDGNGSPVAQTPSVISQATYRKAVELLSKGAGDLHFGMTWTDVNRNLRPSFADSGYEALPLAGEFAPAEVRYLWVRLSAINDRQGFSEYLSLLKPFASCMQDESQSYVVFLFEKNQLIRVSSRFFGDCQGREQLFQDFVKNLGLAIVLPPTSQQMTITIGTAQITWTPGTDADTLDIWKKSSPAPRDIFNPRPATSSPSTASGSPSAPQNVGGSVPARSSANPVQQAPPQL
jgi:hypothetical protein